MVWPAVSTRVARCARVLATTVKPMRTRGIVTSSATAGPSSDHDKFLEHTHIAYAGHPALRDRVPETGKELFEVPERMEAFTKVMRAVVAKHDCLGLSANQICLSIRGFCYQLEQDYIDLLDPEITKRLMPKAVPLRFIMNPVLTPVGDEMMDMQEACLSVPGYFAIVQRHAKVRMEAVNERGEPIDFIAEGYEAGIIQHEYDHLEGKLYTDKMDAKTFTFVQELVPEHILQSANRDYDANMKEKYADALEKVKENENKPLDSSYAKIADRIPA